MALARELTNQLYFLLPTFVLKKSTKSLVIMDA